MVTVALLIERGVNPDTKKYLLMLYASAGEPVKFFRQHNTDSL